MGSMVAVGQWPDKVSGEWTVEMLDDLPDDGLRYEIIDGILQVSPSPVPIHQRAVVRLAVLLSAACPADHEVFVAPLDWQPDRRTSLEPDLMVVPSAAIGPKNISGTPALVVEVTSPSTARIDRLLKFSRYAEGGIGQYWLLDPAAPSIEVFDLVEGAFQLTVAAVGASSLTVTGLLSLTVTPASLVSG